MYSTWAANTTDNVYTVHQAPLFLLFACGITRRKERKKEKEVMSDNKKALWTCLIIIKYHN